VLDEDSARKLKNDVMLGTDSVYLQNVIKKLIDENLELTEALRVTIRGLKDARRDIAALKGEHP
jgi:hypothetical protein